MNCTRARVTHRSRRYWLGSLALCALTGCGAGAKPAPPPPCDEVCQDGIALHGLRLAMKFAFNETVMGQPVGAQDKSLPCLPGGGGDAGLGSVRVFGNATSNADQGSSFLDLSYDFRNCFYAMPPDATADQNLSLTFSGLITEQGTLAQQPSSTTALTILSDSVTVTGTVYDPPLDYSAASCALAVDQDGSTVAGTWCGRAAGFTF